MLYSRGWAFLLFLIQLFDYPYDSSFGPLDSLEEENMVYMAQ